MVPVKVNGENFSMELDTGTSVSIMFEEAWRRWSQKSQIKLKTYTGEALEIIGQVQVEVTYQDQLNELLKDGVELKWSTDQQKSLNQLKDKLSSTSVLTYLTRSYR